MATHIANPRKLFNWSFELIPDPINPWLAQKCKIPDTEVEVVEHGDANHSIKTGGRVSYSNIVMDKLQLSDQGDTYMWGWIDSVQSSTIGGGTLPQIYKKVMLIHELAEDGTTIINSWQATGVFPCKVNGQELDRLSSENTLEQIEFCVDQFNKI